MQVTGEFRFDGSREQVWALLNDEAVLTRCTPGCEQLVRTGDDTYKATLRMGLAAVKGTYEGTLRLTEKQPPESMVLEVEAGGSTGFVTVTGRMDLHEQGPATRVSYAWEVTVGGPVAMVGQRVLSGVARWIISDFFSQAQKELNR